MTSVVEFLKSFTTENTEAHRERATEFLDDSPAILPSAQSLAFSVGLLMLSAGVRASELQIVQAESASQIAIIRELFLEYAQSLGFSLCFQSFDEELAGLPGDYAPPDGRLLLATCQGQAAGCVALHKNAADICEMKRLYVRPQFRGKRLGRALAEAVIAEAKKIGYKRLRLDTVEPLMKAAVAMYRDMGFREITPYRENPIEGALYMELAL